MIPLAVASWLHGSLPGPFFPACPPALVAGFLGWLLRLYLSCRLFCSWRFCWLRLRLDHEGQVGGRFGLGLGCFFSLGRQRFARRLPACRVWLWSWLALGCCGGARF